ncbi:hypothetical protein HN51_040083 [Arachis hypogaea]
MSRERLKREKSGRDVRNGDENKAKQTSTTGTRTKSRDLRDNDSALCMTVPSSRGEEFSDDNREGGYKGC